jgi:multiple sugar transport system substrate-binding protein
MITKSEENGNMKKQWATLGLTVLLAMTSAACGSGATKSDTPSAAPSSNAQETPKGIATSIDGKQVDIEFWHAMTGAQEQALKKITDDFMAKNPNVKVKLVAQGGYNDLQQKLTAAAKAKNTPTMAQTYENWNTEYIDNGIAADLTPYINDPKYGWTKDELNDIAQVYRDDNQWDGKYYSLPFNKSTNVLFYNKTLLDQAGLKVPTTWDELKDAAKKLTQDKPDGKGKVLGMGFENSVGLDFNTYVRQAGGQFIDEKNGKALFNSQEGKDALNFISGFIKDGTGRLAGEDKFMSDPFGRGDVAMYIGSSAGMSFIDKAVAGKFEWAAAPLPKGKKAAAVIQGTNVSVFNTASDEQKLAAWLYIKFLINTENTAYWAMQTGYLPVRTSASNSDVYKQFVKDHPNQGVAEKQLGDGYFYYRGYGANAIQTVLTKEVENANLGKKTVDQALADAEKAANDEIQKAKAASGK